MDNTALLAQIRSLNDEVEQYSGATRPQEIARRDTLLYVLAWYVLRLQMRIFGTESSHFEPDLCCYGPRRKLH